MADVDLDSMELGELKELQKSVEKAISDYHDRKRAEARAAAEAAVRELGYNLDEVIAMKGIKGKSSKSGAPAKYRNPEDPTQSWSGRGRQPQWMKDAIENGANRDDFLIERLNGGHAAG